MPTLDADASRLWRRFAFVSAGALLSSLVSVDALPRPCFCSTLVSAVDTVPVSALLRSHLASATPLARRVAFYNSFDFLYGYEYLRSIIYCKPHSLLKRLFKFTYFIAPVDRSLIWIAILLITVMNNYHVYSLFFFSMKQNYSYS